MNSATEENAVRAMAVMAEQTEGLQVRVLLLPENYLQECKDFRSLKEEEEDPQEIEVDELSEESEEEIAESDGGSDYDDEDDDGGKKVNGKGKAREEIGKSAKPVNDKKSKSKKKPKPAGQVLNELVSHSCSRSCFYLLPRRSEKGAP